MNENTANPTLTIVGYGMVENHTSVMWGINFVTAEQRNTIKRRNILLWGKEFTLSHSLAAPLIGLERPAHLKNVLSSKIACYLIDVLERLPKKLVTDLARSSFDPLLNQEECWNLGWEQYIRDENTRGPEASAYLVAYKCLWTERDWRQFMVSHLLDPFHPVLTRYMRQLNWRTPKSTLFDENYRLQAPCKLSPGRLSQPDPVTK